ncbi:hypothetical protein MTO96_019002 [Rhipicephalus appendiculatus]
METALPCSGISGMRSAVRLGKRTSREAQRRRYLASLCRPEHGSPGQRCLSSYPLLPPAAARVSKRALVSSVVRCALVRGTIDTKRALSARP